MPDRPTSSEGIRYRFFKNIRSVLSSVKSVVGENTPRTSRCKHHSIAEYPDEDTSIWYLLSETVEQEYWSEVDVGYVKLEHVEKDYICLGCGETHSLSVSERLGGEENLKLKSEMGDGEQEVFEKNVRSGAYYNGFPSRRGGE